MKTLFLTLTTTTLLALPAFAQERDQKRDEPVRTKPDFELLEKRIKSAVERGDLTREEAKAKFAEIKKQFEKNRQAERKTERPVSPEEFAKNRRQEEMRKHQAEAMERMQKIRKEAERKAQEANSREHRERREHEEREHHERKEREHAEHKHEHTERQLHEAREHAERQQERHHNARFEAIERSLHQAVEAGLISGLDAQKTMAKLHLAAIKHQQKKSRR